MGNQRHCFQYTSLTTCNNEGLYFFRLSLVVNILDLVRAASFVLSYELLLVPLICAIKRVIDLSH